ncbi:MAG: protein kinase [Pirellulales bacterium]
MATSEQSQQDAVTTSGSQPIDWDVELDSFIVKLERAYVKTPGLPVEISQFCPEPNHPRYSAIVGELIRVDMELATAAGRVPSIEYYRSRFGTLVDDESLSDQLVAELNRLQTRQSTGLAQGTKAFPEIGQSICGFQIHGELGRGSFGRVYLASEVGLANRRVVIKVSSQFPGEAELLSKLQHKNIVPVYSLHHVEAWHVVCMPLLGTATLGGLLHAIERSGQTPASAIALIDTIRNCASQTWQLNSNSLNSKFPSAVDAKYSEIESSHHKSLSIDSVALEKLRGRFEGQSYAHGVLWIIAQLAEGLVHAHERNIIHRDIKPANILLADDGLPMLLDFNLSVESTPDSRVGVLGGTPRYMSPEQLQEVITDRPSSDQRSDIYSLGLILFELLSMQSPFEERQGISRDSLGQMYQDRKSVPELQPARDVGITSGVAAIVKKALQFSADDRYLSAQEFLTDLQCELTHQPLESARGEATIDRIRKWNVRHPRLSAGSIVLAASCIILSAAIFGLIEYRNRANYSQALRTLQEVETKICETQALLAGPNLTPEHLKSLIMISDQSLQSIQSISSSRLTNEQTQLWQDSTAQLLTLRARGRSSLAMRSHQAESSRELLKFALEDLTTAANLAPQQKQINQIVEQAIRNAIEKEDPQSIQTELANGLRLSNENLQVANQSMLARQKYEASNPQFWTNVAMLQLAMGDRTSAKSSLEWAIRLDDSSTWAHLTLGSLELDSQNFLAAKKAMDKVVQLSPSMAAAKFNRALANIGLGQPQAALVDLESLEDSIADNTRILFVREMVYRQLGQNEKSDRDRIRGLELQPSDGLSWNARGEAKLSLSPPDFNGALDDFKMATKVSPNLRNSYQNMATVLSEYLKKPQAAIVALDNAIQCDPQYALAWSGHGVIKARLGNAAEAIEDVSKALELERSAMICYQAASAYAIIRRDDADEKIALRLLRETLSKEPTLAELMPDDADLNGIKDRKTLQQIIAAARMLK